MVVATNVEFGLELAGRWIYWETGADGARVSKRRKGIKIRIVV